MAAVADAEAVANTADTDPLLRGMFSLGMCIARNQMTAFDAAVEWAGRARAALGRASPYLATSTPRPGRSPWRGVARRRPAVATTVRSRSPGRAICAMLAR